MNVADSELMLGHLARSGYTAHRAIRRRPTSSCSTPAPSASTPRSASSAVSASWRSHKLRKPQPADRRGRLHGAAPPRQAARRARRLRRRPRRLPAAARAARAAIPFVDVRLDRDETYADIAPQRADGVRAWITIMRGCDKFCTFCIVPYVRGRERSVPAAAVLEQVRDAAAQGYREVVFLGQTVNAYRDGDIDFAELLRARRRGRRHRAHPLHVAASERHERGGDRGDGDLRQGCAAAAPAGAVGIDAGARAHGARLHAPTTTCALVERLRAAVPGARAHHRHHRRLPRRDGARLRARRSRSCARVRYDSAFMFKYSRARPHARREVGRDRSTRTRRAAACRR